MEQFQGRAITVAGAGRSGAAAAEALAARGAQVTLWDHKAVDEWNQAIRLRVERAGVVTASGAWPEDSELVVTSPGIPVDAPVLQSAVRKGVPVWSEIELAFCLTNRPIVAVTGTNGKTTTTLLIAAMLRAAGRCAIVCGNIAADSIKKTLVEAAVEASEVADATLVAEVSSFQLEWVHQFAPRVAVLTNITPDHLNRHASFAEYAATKCRIFAAQTSSDAAIINFDDPHARAAGDGDIRARRIWFTRGDPPADEAAAWVRDGSLTVRLDHHDSGTPFLPISEMPRTLPGSHSVENALAACAVARFLDAPAGAAAGGIREFPGVAHRMEYVEDVEGVQYINNSMCTNVEAAVRSLQALDRPAIVIAGGADKALDFTALAGAAAAHAKLFVLIGDAAPRIESALRAGGYGAIAHAGTMVEAVDLARRASSPGDVVILSPGCASFGMFTDFEARGAAFRAAVAAIKESVRS